MVKLAFVGDICLGLGLKDGITPEDTVSVFAGVTRSLDKADMRIGNLECCLVGDSVLETVRENPMAAAVPLASSIKHAGFNVLGLANNHILDCGTESLSEALTFCERSGIGTFGAGRNRAEALRPAFIEAHGRRVAFLGFGDTEWYYADNNQPGIAPLVPEIIFRAVDDARKQADLVVVTLHADLEFGFHPATWRVELARQIATRGADLVIQHHPHVLQGIERYGDRLIAYSLGNFVFRWYENEYLGDKAGINETVILHVTADFSGPSVRLSYEAVPVAINRQGLPQLAAPEQSMRIVEHLESVSQALADPRSIRRHWFARCREELRYQWGGLYWTMRDRGVSAFFQRLVRTTKRKDHQRWIKGLLTFGRV